VVVWHSDLTKETTCRCWPILIQLIDSSVGAYFLLHHSVCITRNMKFFSRQVACNFLNVYLHYAQFHWPKVFNITADSNVDNSTCLSY